MHTSITECLHRSKSQSVAIVYLLLINPLFVFRPNMCVKWNPPSHTHTHISTSSANNNNSNNNNNNNNNKGKEKERKGAGGGGGWGGGYNYLLGSADITHLRLEKNHTAFIIRSIDWYIHVES